VTDGNDAAAIRFMLMAMALTAPRVRRKSSRPRAFRSSFKGHRWIRLPASASRPASGPKAARVPLSRYVLFASEVLAGRMPERGKSGTEPSARPSYGGELGLASRRCGPCADTAATRRPRSTR